VKKDKMIRIERLNNTKAYHNKQKNKKSKLGRLCMAKRKQEKLFLLPFCFFSSLLFWFIRKSHATCNLFSVTFFVSHNEHCMMIIAAHFLHPSFISAYKGVKVFCCCYFHTFKWKMHLNYLQWTFCTLCILHSSNRRSLIVHLTWR